MSKTLALKIGEQQFPNNSNPIVLSSYKYSAKRMGNAPVISATVDYPECLDNLWSDAVYVEFRGEKYYLKQTPSSSYDNSKITYKHTIELVSERIVLENVYFFDVVREDTENDKPVSNSSEFSFAGNVEQFAERFNYSAKWSGLDYTVVVDEDVVLEDKHIQFQDQFLYNALQNIYEVYKVPFYFVGKVIHIGYAESILPTVLKYGIEDSLLSISRNNTNNAIYNRITGRGSDRNITYYYPNPTPKGTLRLNVSSNTATYSVVNDIKFSEGMDLERDIVFQHAVGSITGMQYSNDNITYSTYTGGYIPVSVPEDAWFRISFNIVTGGVTYLDIPFTIRGYSTQPVSTFYKDSLLSGDESTYLAYIKDDKIYCSYLATGSYTLTLKVTFTHIGADNYSVLMTPSVADYSYWCYVDGKYPFDLDSAAIKLIDGAPIIGDTMRQEIAKRVNVQNNLMPSIYRKTDGEERFYNAENGVYKDEDGNDIVFSNLYSDTRPREYIYQDEDIYPTIEEMVNANGLRIDMFSEFAFDEHDNDEIYPVGHEREGNYVHPYFFGKLRKFDGEHGFNLFDHAIEGQPMTISMTSGRCSACEFTIGVDEETNSFNTVQVTELDAITTNGVIPAGTLRRDEEGNVLCGRWPQAPQPKQERQNDTINYEVWVALKKEDQTFGVLMPSQDGQYLPEAGDSFVILNINLPEAYVLAAEDRLEKAAIEYMADNNDYKFSYSAKFSRIFFEQNPDVSDILNENSKVKVRYNGIDEELYVASYSYNMTDANPLPEVTIELNDEIKIVKGAFDRIKTDIKYTLGPTINNIGIQLASTTNNLNNVSRTANKANDIATQALSAGEELKTDISEVSVIASDAKLSASLAQSDANQAKEGISAVGNEVGSLKTTITATQIAANKAQSNADRALTEVNNVSEDSNAKFEVVNTSITNINKDVDALESLIGDEYNIWFEPDTQIGGEPTLSNYPASDWTSDDDYFNHDKDLYYSITLGRAWRFMYNEGTPLWEEITDADTITALTKAQEALTKAQEALDGVSSLDFIKGVFSDDEILDEKAAVLSRLVAVKDVNNEVTAGIYGGGVDGLDSAGYKDSSHGTLMMFAGASGASNASNSKFRVYEDGSIFANSGVFGGVIKKGATIVTPENILDFAIPVAGAFENLVIDIARIGSYIVFDGFQNTAWSENYTSLNLPAYYGGDVPSISIGYSFDDLIGLIGVDLIFRATSDINSDLCFSVPRIDFDGEISPVCVTIKEGDIIIATCTARRDSNDDLNIGWELNII